MALDRQSISRRDFPTARRGYDPAAVDAHLAAIADEVDELRRRAGPGATLATHTSDHIRAIIEAAETSAAGIREAAESEARDHLARVAAGADALRERVAAVEREVGELVGGLRAGAERLRAELAEVTAAAATLGDGAGVPPEVSPAALGSTVGAVAASTPGPAEEEGEEPALAAFDEAQSGRSTDVEGARIVAFERAARGRPREETERYLAEHYELPDPAALLDEVYALVPND